MASWVAEREYELPQVGEAGLGGDSRGPCGPEDSILGDFVVLEETNVQASTRICVAGRICAALLIAVSGASCASGSGESTSRVVQPGAPGQASRVLAANEAADMERPQHGAADVRFMQGMIPHHAQAIEMSDLVASRTDNESIRLLARRIDISQKDEIRLMERWLERRGETAPDAADHMHAGDGALMPGMLTAEEMARLAAARGADFDRLFLEGMIAHHQGALTMVGELFSTVGGGQETEVHRFASDVDADQDMEIQRMRSMLNAVP